MGYFDGRNDALPPEENPRNSPASTGGGPGADHPVLGR